MPRQNEFEPRYRVRNTNQDFYPEYLLKILSVKYFFINNDVYRDRVPIRHKFKTLASHGAYSLEQYTEAVPRFYFPRQVRAFNDRAAYLRFIQTEPFRPLETSSLWNPTGTSLSFLGHPSSCSPLLGPMTTHLSEHKFSVTNPCLREVSLALHVPHHRWVRVLVDGKKVENFELNRVQRAVAIPPGEHKIHVRIHAASFQIGLFVSLLSFLGLGVFVFRARASGVSR